MRSFVFWQKWLFYSSLGFALFGILLAVDGNNFLLEIYYRKLAYIFWHGDHFPCEVASFKRFVCGPLGGTIACCYILLAFIAWYPFARKERWSRNAIIIAFGVWFIFDSAVCLYSGVCFQVYIINAFSFLQKALPVFFTWNEFKK